MLTVYNKVKLVVPVGIIQLLYFEENWGVQSEPVRKETSTVAHVKPKFLLLVKQNLRKCFLCWPTTVSICVLHHGESTDHSGELLSLYHNIGALGKPAFCNIWLITTNNTCRACKKKHVICHKRIMLYKKILKLLDL